MQGAGSAQKRRRSRFPGGLRPPREPGAQAVPPKATCAPACTPTRPGPCPPCQRPGGGWMEDTCPRRWGRSYIPCSGVHGGGPGSPTPTAFSETLGVSQAGVRSENKPPHPLLSGLNNRWPRVFSFHQREGNQTAGRLFAVSLESSLSRPRPRKQKPTPRSPASRLKAKTLL